MAFGRRNTEVLCLVGPIAKCCEQVIRQVATEYQAEIIALEIMPDQLHLLIEVGPQFGIPRLVKHIKGVSSHTLRQEFRGRQFRLPTLWTNSYFLSTVGGAPLAVMK